MIPRILTALTSPTFATLSPISKISIGSLSPPFCVCSEIMLGFSHVYLKYY
jgi:hypothetical protein